MNVIYALILLLILLVVLKIAKVISKMVFRVLGLVATAFAIARLYMLFQL